MKKNIFILILLVMLTVWGSVSWAEEKGIKSKGNIQADNTAVYMATEDIQYLHTEIKRLMLECGRE